MTSQDNTPARRYAIRNVVSGLLLPQSLRANAPTLTFDTHDEAQQWLVHIDAPLADFEIVAVPRDC